MKISGYYKQNGHQVSLLKKVDRAETFDLIIISKENNTSHLPPLKLLINKSTRLIGAAFRRQKNYWELPKVIYQARPDYGLYNFEFPTEFTRASFINTSYKSKLIEVQKQDRYELEATINFIVDKNFWEIEDLGAAMDNIAHYTKLIFYEEVDLKKLKNDELIKKFVELRLFPRPIKLKKLTSVYELEEVVKVLNKIKKHDKALAFENITFVTMTKELNKQETLKRYFECIRSAAIANKNLVKMDYLVPRAEAFEYAAIFEPFLNYQNHKNAFFSYMLKKEYYVSVSEILNNQETWNNPVVKDIWTLYHKYKNVFNDGFTRWGGRVDREVNKLDEGDAKKFYDTYIL